MPEIFEKSIQQKPTENQNIENSSTIEGTRPVNRYLENLAKLLPNCGTIP